MCGHNGLVGNQVCEQRQQVKNGLSVIVGQVIIFIVVFYKEREKDIQDAVVSAEQEWVRKYDQSGDWDDKIRNAKETWERQKANEIKEKIAEVRKELDHKLSAAREEWEQLKVVDIEQEVAKARRKWDENVEKMIAEASVSSVSLAKADWTREQEVILRKAVEEGKVEALATAKKEWEQEKKNMVKF